MNACKTVTDTLHYIQLTFKRDPRIQVYTNGELFCGLAPLRSLKFGQNFSKFSADKPDQVAQHSDQNLGVLPFFVSLNAKFLTVWFILSHLMVKIVRAIPVKHKYGGKKAL